MVVSFVLVVLDDSTGVALKLRGINGNRDYSLGNSVFKGLSVLGLYINVSTKLLGLKDSLLCVILALQRQPSGVWVTSLVLRTKVSNILEGTVHETSLASVVLRVSLGTVYKLLLREAHWGLGVGEGVVGKLDGSVGRERPARSAGPLVLDSGKVGSPVYFSRVGGTVSHGAEVRDLFRGASFVTSELSKELFLCKVRELSEANLVGNLGFELLDLLEVVDEDP